MSNPSGSGQSWWRGLLRSAGGPQLANSANSANPTNPAISNAALPAPASELSVTDVALAWLDALLRQHVTRQTGNGNEFGGLAVSRQAVEQLLNTSSELDSPATATLSTAVERAQHILMQAMRNSTPGEQPLADLCIALELDELESAALIICIAPEWHPKYQRIFGYLQDDLTRRHASLGLVCALLGAAHEVRRALVEAGKLLGARMLCATSEPHAEEALRLDPALTAWLFGRRDALLNDARLRPLIRANAWPGANWYGSAEYLQQSAKISSTLVALSAEGPPGRLLLVCASHAARLRALLEIAGAAAALNWLRIPLPALVEGEMLDGAQDLHRLAWLARLTPAWPLLDLQLPNYNHERLREILAALAELPQASVIMLPEAADILPLLAETGALSRVTVLRLAENADPAHDELPAWRHLAQEAGAALDDAALLRLMSAMRLDTERFALALQANQLAPSSHDNPAPEANAELSAESSTESTEDRIALACMRVGSRRLPRFARLLEPGFKLEHVVLPPTQAKQLLDIVGHISHAATVLHDWGFAAQLPYGRGVAALFAGPSGTGKTMAACAIGHALQRAVYAVDLSRVVSKYIGETEKNLQQVFEEAEQSGAVLLFDEADALFGKRSEVKDAHDRYANLETAYLLQRMEAFEGLAILTSNFGQNMDRAFLRRLRFVIDFPLPDRIAREKIWRQCLPKTAPQASDIDFAYLAQRIDISGGHIRQITVRAAFAAAAEDCKEIAMRHILAACRAEALKLGMHGLDRDLSEEEDAA